MPTSGFSDESEAVLAASDCVSLFGTNPKRAEIRYRRLARAVHPDMGGTSEAMARLNSMWDEYRSRYSARPREDGKRRPTEVARNASYAILDEGERWLVVERSVARDVGAVSDVGELRVTFSGAPVCAVRCIGTRLIAQSDGAHRAYDCERDQRSGGRVLMLSNMTGALPGGTLDPADLAWVTKRVIFLSGALAKCGMSLANPMDSLCVATDTHMLVISAPWNVREDGRHVRSEFMGAYEATIDAVVGSDDASTRIMRFCHGIEVDSVTSEGRLLTEFDELCVELFGGIRFHKMEVL